MRKPTGTTGTRQRLLDQCVEHVLDHGLIGLSLRPIAAAVGTSDRMLIYHFGNKERLIEAIVRQANDGLLSAIAADTSTSSDSGAPRLAYVIDAAWSFLTDADNSRLSRLYLEVCILSAHDRPQWADLHRLMRNSWSALLDSSLVDVDSPTTRDALKTLIVDTVDGLLLDHLVTGDTDRVHAALEAFIALVDHR